MPSSLTAPSSSPINEVGRVAVVVPNVQTRYSETEVLLVAFDAQPDGTRQPTVIGDAFPLNGAYRFASTLLERTQATVDGALLVDGAPIRPEQYLARWRQAIEKTPASFASLAGRHGLVLVVTIDAPFAANEGATSTRSSTTHDTFAAFVEAHGDAMTITEDRARFRLEVPLTSTADVATIDTLLSFVDRYDAPERAIVTTTLRPAADVVGHIPAAPVPHAGRAPAGASGRRTDDALRCRSVGHSRRESVHELSHRVSVRRLSRAAR